MCATDAGREGELIFRYIYEAAGCTKPVKRLWISSLTPEAIRKGFAAAAARPRLRLPGRRGARAQPSRLAGGHEPLAGGHPGARARLLSVGRVQTPTLAMLVERERAIRAFVPEDYLEVVATFAPADTPAAPDARAEIADRYRGTWFRGDKPTPEARRLPKDGVEARAVVERARRGEASIESVRSRDAPPAAAAPLRPHRAAAARQPALRPVSAQGHPGRRAVALRTAQAPHLPAHRQPAPVARRGRDAARGGGGDRRARTARSSRPARASGRSRPALRRRREGHRPPRHHPDRQSRPGQGCSSRRTSGASTTSSAAGCSWPGTTSTSSR